MSRRRGRWRGHKANPKVNRGRSSKLDPRALCKTAAISGKSRQTSGRLTSIATFVVREPGAILRVAEAGKSQPLTGRPGERAARHARSAPSAFPSSVGCSNSTKRAPHERSWNFPIAARRFYRLDARDSHDFTIVARSWYLIDRRASWVFLKIRKLPRKSTNAAAVSSSHLSSTFPAFRRL